MGNNEPGNPDSFNLLVLTDIVDQRVYNHHIKDNFNNVDLLISCGDLPFYYLEFVIDSLNKPMYFVHGNHDPEEEHTERSVKTQPWGAENLDGRVIDHQGLILAGFEGCLSYTEGVHEYTQLGMWIKVLKTVPRLWFTRLRSGRYFDVLVTHAPAWDLGDKPDKVHRGFKSFRWLIEKFKPRYHLHGHVHILDRSQVKDIQFEDTQIINAYTYRRLRIEMEGDDE